MEKKFTLSQTDKKIAGFTLAMGLILFLNGSCELYVARKEKTENQKWKILFAGITIVVGAINILINFI